MSTTLDRGYRWVSDPDVTLPYGVPALLRVTVCGHASYFYVADAGDGAYRMTEELPGGRLAHSVEVDTTFGPDVEHWECSCRHYRARNPRGVTHGCLHTRVLHAALGKRGACPVAS